jgi:hypothetical protein
MGERRRDKEKERYWAKAIGDAARSGISIREFCRRRKLSESRFYWWQRRLKDRTLSERRQSAGSGIETSFALVSDGSEVGMAGVELVLSHGQRLRIGRGIDEQTLRTVLAVLEQR